MGRREDEGRPANHLRAWRELRGLTQAQLAAMVGTEGSVISLLESGDRGLSDKWLRRLALPLQTAPGILLDFHPDDVDQTIFDTWTTLLRKPTVETRPCADAHPSKRPEESLEEPPGKVEEFRKARRGLSQHRASKSNKKT